MAGERTTSTARPLTRVQPSTDLPSIEPLLRKLRSDGVIISAPQRVQGYLAEFPDVLDAVAPVCHAARMEFPEPAELSLDLYVDPEIEDRYLTLYIRPIGQDDALISRIETLAAAQDPLLMDKTGRLELTADFRSPGSVRGV